MARIRRSRRGETAGRLLAAATAAWAAGCGPSSFETTTALPAAPRRPDGVVLEPPPARPPVRERVSVSSVVGLREAEVEAIVRAYVQAFEREDLPALEALLSPDARPLNRSGNRAALVETWKTRMRSADRTRTPALHDVRLRDIEIQDDVALDAAGVRPDLMTPGDLLVRVPMARTRSPGAANEALVLLLRREGGRLRIAGQADEG